MPSTQHFLGYRSVYVPICTLKKCGKDKPRENNMINYSLQHASPVKRIARVILKRKSMKVYNGTVHLTYPTMLIPRVPLWKSSCSLLSLSKLPQGKVPANSLSSKPCGHPLGLLHSRPSPHSLEPQGSLWLNEEGPSPVSGSQV